MFKGLRYNFITAIANFCDTRSTYRYD